MATSVFVKCFITTYCTNVYIANITACKLERIIWLPQINVNIWMKLAMKVSTLKYYSIIGITIVHTCRVHVSRLKRTKHF